MMDMKMSCKEFFYKYRYAFFFVLAYALSASFIFTGDDWAWGSRIGIIRLQECFYDYGGRYLGYIIVLALTRSIILRNIVMALSFTLLTYLFEKISGNQFAVILVPLLLFTLPKNVWRQSIVWTSGFSNYAISILLSILSIFCLRNILYEDVQSPGRDADYKGVLQTIAFFIMGVANTLIVEHMTLYNLFIGIVFFFCYLLKVGRVNPCCGANLIGNAIGMIAMFSNSAYHNIHSGKDDYRSIPSSLESLFSTAKKQWVNNISTEGVQANYLLNLVLSAFLVIALIKCSYKIKHIIIKTLGIVSVSGCVSFSAWSYFSQHMIGEKSSDLVKVEGLLSILFLFCLLISMGIIGYYLNCFWDSMLFSVSIFVVLVPLTVVSPIGGRCYFAADCFLILIICLIGKKAEVFGTGKINNQYVVTFLLIVTITAYIQYIYIYSSISIASKRQLNELKQYNTSNEVNVTIFPLPYESYLWCSRLDGIWKYRYRLFYNIPWNIDFHYEE